MSSQVRELNPSDLWNRFADLNSIPRPSKHEEKVCEWIVGWAREKGLEVEQDKVENIIIRKPATAGMEDRQTVVLQSHVDMVCQKNNDTEFDFMTEGIKMYVDGDWVRAEGTTLGADNKTYIAGLKDATISLAGLWDATADAIFGAVVGQSATLSYEYSPEGTASGKIKYFNG